MKKIWLVWGHSGEYSDSRDWVVCFYRTEAAAKEHVELASAREREIVQWRVDHEDDCYDTFLPKVAAAQINRWDPENGGKYRSYTGINYTMGWAEHGPVKEGP